MNQQKHAPGQLFHEDFFSALDEDIRALGGRKAVAMALRPDLAHRPHEAHVWLNGCMNPDRREKFSDDQIRLIMRKAREVGSCAAMNYWCDDTGFERARALTPEKEADKLLERAAELARESRAVATQLERLHQSGTLRAIAKAAAG